MPIRYSSVVGGSSSNGFNLDVGASGNTTFYFNSPQPAGGYSITSQLADSSIEFYAIAEDGTLAGYTNTKALSATKDFDTLVVYGATNNDLITFEYKSTTLPTASGDQDSGAAPFITSVSDADLANIDDTTIITGGNFATDVAVTFTGTDSVVRNAKSVVHTNSTQLIVTRPDDFLENNSPYTLTVFNPGITQSAIVTNTSPITAGGDPTWVTNSGSLTAASVGTPYNFTLAASDPDGGAIVYSIASGSLPAGLSLNANTGEISGTSTIAETQSFVISATDLGGNVTNRSFSIEALAMPALDALVAWYDFQDSANDLAIGTGYGDNTAYDLVTTNTSYIVDGFAPGKKSLQLTESPASRVFNTAMPWSGNPQFSVSMWIKRETANIRDGVWGIGGGNTGNGINSYSQAFSSKNEIGWDLWAAQRFSTNQEYPLNQWIHIVWIKFGAMDQTGLKCVINGVEYGVVPEGGGATVTPSVTSGFALGEITANAVRNVSQLELYDVRVFNRALTTKEAQDIYTITSLY